MSTTRLYRYYRGKTNSYHGENFYRYIANDKISPIPTDDHTHYQTLKSFQSQQIHAETCAMLLGDDWQMKTMCVLKSAENIKHVWYPPTGWNQSLKLKKNQSLWALYTTRFSVESVKSNLQTGSDCQQLASTSPDCKSEENWGKNCIQGMVTIFEYSISWFNYRISNRSCDYCLNFPHVFYAAAVVAHSCRQRVRGMKKPCVAYRDVNFRSFS